MFSINYVGLLACAICASFFVKGARLDDKSPLVWGGLSIAAWLIATWLIGGGLILGILSQVLLFVGITLHDARRDQAASMRRE